MRNQTKPNWPAHVRLETALLTQAAADSRQLCRLGVPAREAARAKLAEALRGVREIEGERAAWDAANDGDRFDGLG